MNKLMAMVEKRSVASSALQTLRVVQIISKPPPPLLVQCMVRHGVLNQVK